MFKKLFTSFYELFLDDNMKMSWVVEDWCSLMRGTPNPMPYRKNS